MDKPTCSISGCEKLVKARQMCGQHYGRWRLYGNPTEPSHHEKPKICSVEGCERKHTARGYCDLHWNRWKKHGDPLVGGVPQYEPMCGVESCSKESSLQGYCRAHYRRLKLYGDPEGEPRSRKRFCDIDGCGKPAMGHGMCNLHYRRWYKSGDARDYGSRIHGDDIARFWSYVKKGAPGECWEWMGTKSVDGYGVLLIANKTMYMPRFSYELHIEPVGSGLEPDHLCRNRSCVNPFHLEPVTHKVNILRGESPSAINARKTHCIRGHAFDEKNTRINKHGGRSCKTCQKMHDRNRYRKAA